MFNIAHKKNKGYIPGLIGVSQNQKILLTHKLFKFLIICSKNTKKIKKHLTQKTKHKHK